MIMLYVILVATKLSSSLQTNHQNIQMTSQQIGYFRVTAPTNKDSHRGSIIGVSDHMCTYNNQAVKRINK